MKHSTNNLENAPTMKAALCKICAASIFIGFMYQDNPLIVMSCSLLVGLSALKAMKALQPDTTTEIPATRKPLGRFFSHIESDDALITYANPANQ